MPVCRLTQQKTRSPGIEWQSSVASGVLGTVFKPFERLFVTKRSRSTHEGVRMFDPSLRVETPSPDQRSGDFLLVPSARQNT